MGANIKALGSFGFIKGSDATLPGRPAWTVTSVDSGVINGKLTSVPTDSDLDVCRPKYRIYSATEPADWTDGSDITSPAVDSTFQLSGLTNGTTYEVTVVAVDNIGNESVPGNISRITVNAASGDLSPAGGVSLPMTNLETLLANCSSFQTWTSTDNADSAKDYIHFVEADLDNDTYPFAVIDQGDEYEPEAIAGGGAQQFQISGSLVLMFENAITADYRTSARNAKIEFNNAVGQILDDMRDLAGTETYLNITKISQQMPAERSSLEEEEQGKYFYQATYIIWWGV